MLTPYASRKSPQRAYTAQVGIFVIVLFAALYVTRDIALPIVLAVLFTITLAPVVRRLERYGVPAPATAAGIVLGLTLISATAVYFLSGPVMGWVKAAPLIGQELQLKLLPLRGSFAAVLEATETAGEIAEPTEADVQKVEVQDAGMVTWAASGMAQVLGMAGLTFALLLFLLASGQTVHEKIVHNLPTLTDKKRALRLVYNVEHDVSRYLLTIAAINSGLGVVIGVSMWIMEMPNPALWGVAAALLNFMPYIGAAIGIGTVAIVALVSFDTLLQAAVPPLVYLAATAIEGTIVTPVILGRRLAINSVAILLALALWSWLWGIPGALIAVPLLVAAKAFCDQFEGLSTWSDVLSPGGSAPLSEDETRKAA